MKNAATHRILNQSQHGHIYKYRRDMDNILELFTILFECFHCIFKSHADVTIQYILQTCI